MDDFQYQAMILFVKLLYSNVEDTKAIKKLIFESKKVLRKLHLQMNLNKFEDSEIQHSDENNMQSCDKDVKFLQMTFSTWLHAILVTPYAPFMPELVKKVYDALEIEDLKIDFDLNCHSKQKANQASKKRKRSSSKEVIKPD